MAHWKWIWLASMRIQVWFLASLRGLRIWCCCELWCRLQMWLGPGIAVAVVWAGGYSSDSTPCLGTYICCGCDPKKRKKKNFCRVLLWHSRLRIWCCHCSLGHCYGASLIPGPGTCACHGCSQKIILQLLPLTTALVCLFFRNIGLFGLKATHEINVPLFSLWWTYVWNEREKETQNMSQHCRNQFNCLCFVLVHSYSCSFAVPAILHLLLFSPSPFIQQ